MQSSHAVAHHGGTVTSTVGWSWQRPSGGTHDEEEGKAHLLAWAIGLGWRDGRSALGHVHGAALMAHRWEYAKLVRRWAVIKAL